MAKNKRIGKELRTQKDGRLYAIEVLLRLQNVSPDNATACPFNDTGVPGDSRNPPQYWRTGPQWPGFLEDVFHLFRNGTEEAQTGFLSLLTDCFGGEVNMDIRFYRELEKKGYLQDFGNEGRSMPLPNTYGSWKTIERISGWKPDLVQAGK